MDIITNSQQFENTTSPENTLCSCNGDYLIQFSGSEFACKNDTGRKLVVEVDIDELSIDSIQCLKCEKGLEREKFFELNYLIDLQYR